MKFVLSILAAASVAIAVPAAAQNEQAAQTTSRLAQAAKTRAAAELAGPSVLALYLAGNTAFQEGRFEEATDFFARGSSAATGEARPTGEGDLPEPGRWGGVDATKRAGEAGPADPAGLVQRRFGGGPRAAPSGSRGGS